MADLTFEGGEAACKKWYANYTLSVTLVYSLSAFISALGAVLRVFLREISHFEGKHTVTERLASATTKMWSVQFISTALLLLIINARTKETSKIFATELKKETSVFTGRFDDFYAEWYGAVGSSICLTCYLNTVVPWANFAFWLAKGILRCFDRKGSWDMRRTRQIIQEDYEEQYMGNVFQIENRYA